MDHKWHKCDCYQTGCWWCGGVEGSLTKDCCGYSLDEHVLDAVYKGALDYKDGEWIVYRQRCSNCIWYKYPQEDKCIEKREKLCRNYQLWKE